MDDIVSHSSPPFLLKTSKKWGNSCRCREKFITLHGNILLTHAYDARKYTENLFTRRTLLCTSPFVLNLLFVLSCILISL